MIGIIVLCLIATLAKAHADTMFKDCGSVDGKIMSLEITPCPRVPCVLTKGTNATVKIEIKANVDVTSAKTIVHGIIGIVTVPFPLPDDNACSSSMECPVKSGANTMYRNSIFVQEGFPAVHVNVRWEILDQSEKSLVCFTVPVQITD